ncbi:MAG TPA: zf-HC2 domain-containing protein [Vicinamibacterales bacterium]
MPDCSRIVSLLSDYIDGRLPGDIRTDLEKHLSGCSECTAFVGTFRSTVTLLQSLSEDDLPEELRLRLKAFLDDRCTS